MAGLSAAQNAIEAFQGLFEEGDIMDEVVQVFVTFFEIPGDLEKVVAGFNDVA